jgi:hypothetical protein
MHENVTILSLCSSSNEWADVFYAVTYEIVFGVQGPNERWMSVSGD